MIIALISFLNEINEWTKDNASREIDVESNFL